MKKWKMFFKFISISIFPILMVAQASAAPFGRQAVRKDAFPVFNNPRMMTAEEAEQREFIFPRDAVVGIAHGDQAKAYPITIMGVHELGNDTIDGIPIAVSW